MKENERWNKINENLKKEITVEKIKINKKEGKWKETKNVKDEKQQNWKKEWKKEGKKNEQKGRRKEME